MSKLFNYLLLGLLLLPAEVFGASQFIPCGTSDTDLCKFSDLYILLGKIMDFLLLKMAVPIGVLVIIYGGVLIAINPIKPSELEKGKKAIITAIYGLIIALGAYVIVKFILVTLTGDKVNLNNPATTYLFNSIFG